jgi:hypothetical protein
MSWTAPPAGQPEGSAGWPWWWPIRVTDLSGTAGGAVTTSGIIPATGVVRQLVGWAIKETTGAAGSNFVIWDGVNTQGKVIVPINLAANESTRDRSGPPGLWCLSGGLYLQMVSGSISGVVYWV